MHNHYLTIGSAFGVAMLSAGFLCAGTSAVSSSTTASVTVSAACTLSGANHNYYDTISGGETKTFGPSSIKATCNDTAGYSLYAIGFSGDSYNGNNTKMIGTNTNIDTATSGNTSRWSMQVASVAGTYAPTIMNSFDSAHVIPADYAQVAKYTSLTDGGDNAEGSNIQVSYTVSISPTQAVDTYTGKVKYTLVHPNDAAAPVAPLADTDCPANKICYAPNTGDIDGSMESISTTKITKSPTAGVQSTSSNATPTLIAPNYSRDGYGFAGWSTDFEATSSSKVYGPNETITTSTTAGSGDADVSTNGLILYPVWIASTGNLQSWSGCSSLVAATYDSATGEISATLASVTALTDQRDGNTYTVARLVDGNCWMTENLRLNADNTRSDANKALAQGYGDATANNMGKFIGLADSENANFSNTNPPAANNLYSVDGSNGTININTINYPFVRIPRYNSNNTNRELTAKYNASSSSSYYQWYGYGNYYNWPAAIANTDSFITTTTNSDGYTLSEATSTSLCPIGWKLPYGRSTGKGATTGGFSYLDVQMGGTGTSQSGDEGAAQLEKWRSFPNSFVYSGYYDWASSMSRSSRGSYWSSTACDSSNSYRLMFDSSNLNPGSSSHRKYNGYSIRCIVNP